MKLLLIFKPILRYFLNAVTWLIGNTVPKQKKLILFTGSTTSHYNESGKYLYEYFSNKEDFIAVWLTRSNTVYKYLDSQNNRNVVFVKSIQGMLCFLRAGTIVSTGGSSPNIFRLVGNKTVTITLGHGVGPRSANAVDDELNDNPLAKSALSNLQYLHKFDYLNFTSKFTIITIGKLQFMIPKNKRILLGYPRCDHLFDINYAVSKLNDKVFYNSVFSGMGDTEKVILYSPTWRPNNRKQSLPMRLLSGFDIGHFDRWLENSNLYLLISVHPIVEREYEIKHCSRIKYIEDDPLVDINQIIMEADLLITDYSSIATDYMIMDRPVLYVMPDYDFYLYEYGMIEDFRLNLPGYEAKTFDELCDLIIVSINAPGKHKGKRKAYLSRYYDTSITDSSYKCYQFIKNIQSK